MKKSVIILGFVLILSSGKIFADNFFQTSNPFMETSPQTMNNIYESEPAVLQQEAKKSKKAWFKKGKNLTKSDNYVDSRVKTYPVNEGVQENNGFYMFK